MGWDFRLLGSLAVQRDGTDVPVVPAQQRVVLAALLVGVPGPVDGERIAGHLWGHEPPPTARGTVHSLVSRLRRTLERPAAERILETTPAGYRLRVDPETIDVRRFEAGVVRGRAALARGEPSEAAAELAAALALWRGEPLIDVPADDLRGQVGPALVEYRLAALESLCDAELALGHYHRVAARLLSAIAEAPLRERFHQQVMRALHGAGRRGEAIEAYHTLRRRLIDDLGVEPDPRTQQVYREIIAVARETPETWRSPAQLPPVPAIFTGRGGELARLSAAAPARSTVDEPAPGPVVVTISGLPGVGKTALAVKWAHLVAGAYRDGQLFVDLHPRGRSAVEPLTVLGRLLRATGMARDQIPDDLDEAAAAYRTRLSGRRVLLLLDDAAGDEQIRPLLPGGSGSLVIVTSRNRLADFAAEYGADRITLGPMAPADATELLGRLMGAHPSANPALLRHIARRCGYLPANLRAVAARFADRPHLPLGEYLARFGSTPHRPGPSAAVRYSGMLRSR